MQRRLRSRDGSKGSKPSLSRKGGWESVPSRHQRRESATKPSRFGGTNSTSTAAATAGVQMRRDTPRRAGKHHGARRLAAQRTARGGSDRRRGGDHRAAGGHGRSGIRAESRPPRLDRNRAGRQGVGSGGPDRGR